MNLKKNLLSNSLFIRKKSSKDFNFKIEKIKINQISTGEVIIKTKYSCLNYKDVLICNGNPGLVRKYPHVPGIDASGIIVETKSKKFKKGDKVVIVARSLGVSCFGGLSEYIKVSSKLVEKKPMGLSLKDSMIYGTAGFTAMLAIQKLIGSRIKKQNLPILVTGSTGGVGTIVISILNSYGYRVIAATSLIKNREFLISIGADEVITYDSFDSIKNLPLLKEVYYGVIDCSGTEAISNIIKKIKKNGKLVLVGNVQSQNVNFSLIPFILRGISIIGVNSESVSLIERKKIWKNIINLKIQKNLSKIYSEITLLETPKYIDNIRKNHHVGRIIVNFFS